MTTKSKLGAACVAFCLAAVASAPASAAWKGVPVHQNQPHMAKVFRSDVSAHRGVPLPHLHHPRLPPKAIKVPRNYPHDPRYGPH